MKSFETREFTADEEKFIEMVGECKSPIEWQKAKDFFVEKKINANAYSAFKSDISEGSKQLLLTESLLYIADLRDTIFIYKVFNFFEEMGFSFKENIKHTLSQIGYIIFPGQQIAIAQMLLSKIDSISKEDFEYIAESIGAQASYAETCRKNYYSGNELWTIYRIIEEFYTNNGYTTINSYRDAIGVGFNSENGFIKINTDKFAIKMYSGSYLIYDQELFCSTNLSYPVNFSDEESFSDKALIVETVTFEKLNTIQRTAAEPLTGQKYPAIFTNRQVVIHISGGRKIMAITEVGNDNKYHTRIETYGDF